MAEPPAMLERAVVTQGDELFAGKSGAHRTLLGTVELFTCKVKIMMG